MTYQTDISRLHAVCSAEKFGIIEKTSNTPIMQSYYSFVVRPESLIKIITVFITSVMSLVGRIAKLVVVSQKRYMTEPWLLRITNALLTGTINDLELTR